MTPRLPKNPPPDPVDPADPAQPGAEPMTPPVAYDTSLPSIYVLMGNILRELPAIGKDSENKEQHFMFRGIDSVLDALNPIMGKYGVFVVPHEVVELEFDQRTTKGGSTMYVTRLLMKYRFYGPRGDFVAAVGIGEGTDMGDKGAPKSMTGAYKYVLFETFAISTKEAASSDPDMSTMEDTVPAELSALSIRLDVLPDKWRDTVLNKYHKDAWNGEKMSVLEAPPSWWSWLDKAITNAEARAAAEAQDADAEASQDPTPDPTHVPTPSVAPPAAPAPPTAPAPEPPATPAPSPSEPDPTLAAPSTAPTPDVSAPDTSMSAAPSDEPIETSDEVTWEYIDSRTAKQLRDALKAIPGILPERYGSKINAEDMKVTWWFAIGGAPDEGEQPGAEGYECPFCNTFGYPDFDSLTDHMTTMHDDDGNAEDDTTAPDDTTPAPAANTPDPAPDADPLAAETVDEATLEIIKVETGKLKGATARAFADYRRQMGLPARYETYTKAQAFDLIDFLDKLPIG